QVIEGKTSALLGCAAQLGALSGGAPPARAEHFRQFGINLGLAFQIQDDLLGIWGDPRETGKPRAADVHTRKITLPVLEALHRASPDAARLIQSTYRTDVPTADEVDQVIATFDRLGVHDVVAAEATSYVE